MQQAIDALLVSVPVPELATGRTYDFECQLKNDFALAAEQLVKSRTTLQRYKDHLLHATLLDNNQILEIRPLQLVATEQELPCIRIRYPVSIVSNIAFTAVDDDDALHCWLLSQNGLLVRHNLTDAFLKQPLENWTFTTPVESIANKHFVCMSVASSGVATIGCEDGTVVHVQDLERQSAPASSIHFHIVHQDEHFCEFQLRDSTTFGPLLMLQRMGSYVGWRLDSILEEPSSISRLSSLTSADVPLSKNSHAGLTAALRKDNRISLWSWTNSPQWSAAQVQRVVELPRFDADGTLIDPHDQDMTYQLPGSFQQAPLRSSKGFGSASFYNEEANLVRLLPHSAGRCKLLVYIEAENPFVAVYDIHLNRSGHIDLVMLMDTVTKPSRSRRQQHLDLSASLRKDGNQEALDIWIVSEEGSGLQIAHTSVPVHETGMKGAPVSHPVWRLAESKNESKSMSSTHSYVVQEKDVLVSTADTVFALRDLDVMEIAYYQSTVTGGNNSSYAARDNYPPYVPNSVLHMDSKQYQGVCYLFESIAPVIKELDQDIRREIIDTLGRYLGESGQQFAMQEIYNNVAKNISTLEDIESINEDAVRTVLQSFSNKVECAQNVESGKVTEALTLSAVRDILQMRFDTISSLVLLLSHHIHKCGQNSLQSLAVSAIDTLRIYGALLWISEIETSNEDDDDDKNNNASTYPASSTSILRFLVQKAYPITVKSERHLDIGSAAYSLISKLGAHDNDILIDIFDKLSSLGLISTALKLAQRYLDTSTEAASEKKGHKADVIHSITFREQLQHLKLKEASKTLQAVEEPDFQKRLAQELIDTAYAHADYQIICQLSPQSLRCQVDDLLLQRAENEKNTAALGKKSWWQICYSFYTFSGDHEQANKCMLKYLEKTGRQDSLLQNFFVQSE